MVRLAPNQAAPEPRFAHGGPPHFGVNFTTDPSARLLATVPSFVQYTLVASTVPVLKFAQ